MRPIRLSTAAVAAILCVLVLTGCGQERTSTSVHMITDNGAIIIVRENRASGVVATQLYVRDGAFFEASHEAGAANLLRSLMFKETESRGPGEIQSSIEGLGGMMSSAGRHDFVQYAVTVPSENFDEAVELIRDGLLNARFDPDGVEREKKKILEYIDDMLKRPVDLAYRFCLSELMGDHPYGRLAEGVPEILSGITVEDIERRYRERYVGSNILVAVSGDVDAVAASEKIAEVLAGLETGLPAEPASPPVTWPTESRTVTRRVDVRKACQVIGFPGPGIADSENVTMDVLLVILAEGGSSRLNTRLKEELGLVHSVGAGWYTQRHPSPLFVWMELPEENIEAAEEAAVELIKEMAEVPVDAEELAKAKMQLEVGNLRMVETAEGQAFHDGYWNSIGGEEFASEYLERLGSVTADEVQQAAAHYLGGGIHIAAVVLPE
ncbi:MAG: pitrilysin family protein [Candidatus Eisenbacteria bacterium]